MSASELKSFISAGEKEGYTLSTSKELGKAQDLLKVLEPSKYGSDQVASATKKLQVNTTTETQQKLGIAPKTSEELPSYLDNYQNSTYSTANSLASDLMTPDTADQIKEAVTPDTEKPELLNRVETREQLRADYGVTELETQLNDLKKQEEDATALLRINTHTEEGKAVPLSVIQGRVSEQTRIAQEKLDTITRAKNSVVNELNTKYSIINQYITDLGLDYQDAVTAYDKEYQNNLAIYNAVQTSKKDAYSVMSSERAAASANLTTYVNLITKGNLSYSNLSSDQKAMITKLEVQAGLPVGFISSVKKDANADIIFTSSNNGVTQVGFKNADGTISVKSYGTSTKEPTESDKTKALYKDMYSSMTSRAGSDGKVSPDTWNQAIKGWVAEGGKREDFINQFADFVNTTHSEDYAGYDDVYGG